MSKRTLLVWPNPFHAVDHEGHPAGILPYEPMGDGVNTFDDRRFIGAMVKAEVIQKFAPGDGRQSVQRTGFVYADEPIRVHDSAYYRHAIARGEIFAADAASALLCGIDSGTFLEPGPLLERARVEAIGEWERQAHEEHDGVPDALKKFAFGPMPEAVAARKTKIDKLAEEATDAAARAVSEKTKKSVQPVRGGE